MAVRPVTVEMAQSYSEPHEGDLDGLGGQIGGKHIDNKDLSCGFTLTVDSSEDYHDHRGVGEMDPGRLHLQAPGRAAFGRTAATGCVGMLFNARNGHWGRPATRIPGDEAAETAMEDEEPGKYLGVSYSPFQRLVGVCYPSQAASEATLSSLLAHAGSPIVDERVASAGTYNKGSGKPMEDHGEIGAGMPTNFHSITALRRAEEEKATYIKRLLKSLPLQLTDDDPVYVAALDDIAERSRSRVTQSLLRGGVHPLQPTSFGAPLVALPGEILTGSSPAVEDGRIDDNGETAFADSDSTTRNASACPSTMDIDLPSDPTPLPRPHSPLPVPPRLHVTFPTARATPSHLDPHPSWSTAKVPVVFHPSTALPTGFSLFFLPLEPPLLDGDSVVLDRDEGEAVAQARSRDITTIAYVRRMGTDQIAQRNYHTLGRPKNEKVVAQQLRQNLRSTRSNDTELRRAHPRRNKLIPLHLVQPFDYPSTKLFTLFTEHYVKQALCQRLGVPLPPFPSRLASYLTGLSTHFGLPPSPLLAMASSSSSTLLTSTNDGAVRGSGSEGESVEMDVDSAGMDPAAATAGGASKGSAVVAGVSLEDSPSAGLEDELSASDGEVPLGSAGECGTADGGLWHKSTSRSGASSASSSSAQDVEQFRLERDALQQEKDAHDLKIAQDAERAARAARCRDWVSSAAL